MKRISVILLLVSAAFCTPLYLEAQASEIFRQEGIASWYGPEFDGRPTASGEIFNSSFLTAAHPTLPFGTMLRVTNRHNNKQVTVKVNDRGPFVSARIIDVSKAAAEQLDMLSTGTAPVLVESVERIVISSPPGGTAPADPYWTLPPAQSAGTPPLSQPPQQAAPPAPVYTPPPAITEAPPPVYQPAPVYVPPPAETPPPVYTPAPPSAYTPPPAETSQPAPVYTPPPAPVYTPPSAPAPIQPPAYRQATLTPAITPSPNKVYRLQIGSYRVAKNAVDTFEKLKNAGLSPAYERNGEYFRVVLAGIQGTDVQSIAERLGAAGFREALIREER